MCCVFQVKLPPKGINAELLTGYNIVPVVEPETDILKDKPWKKPGMDYVNLNCFCFLTPSSATGFLLWCHFRSSPPQLNQSSGSMCCLIFRCWPLRLLQLWFQRGDMERLLWETAQTTAWPGAQHRTQFRQDDSEFEILKPVAYSSPADHQNISFWQLCVVEDNTSL